MKKTILLAIMMIASTVGCFAQLDENTFFLVGKAGANISNTHHRSGNQYNNWKADFLVGVGVGYQFDEKWALTADVVYCEQGVRETSGQAFVDGVFVDVRDITTSFNYINVPVMANYYVAPGLALKAGVQVGFLTSANDKFTATAMNGVKKEEIKIDEKFTDSCNKIDFAIPVGISYDITENIQLDLRYVYGLTNIIKDKYSDIMQCKNKSVTLTIGYRLPL